MSDAGRLLSKYGFYVSFAIFLYTILFPFRFDFSPQYLSTSWSQAGLIPFWNAQEGIHITLDDLANVLLTIPLGFFGVLLGSGRKKVRTVCKWCVLGLMLGLAAEFAQLAVLTRSSGITDVVNNGLGAALGAFIGCTIGQGALEFFTGTATERRNIYLWLLIWSMVAMLGPYDLGPGYASSSGIGTVMLHAGSSAPEIFTEKEWLRMACFALIGALAVRLAVPGRRKRSWRQPLSSAALVLLLPIILHLLRLLVETRSPYLDDLALDIFAALTGAFISLLIPPALRAFSGLLLFKTALIAAALNPYNFTNWSRGGSFQWVPFHALCTDRSPFAFYEAILSLFTFAIFGGLLQLSFKRLRRWHIILYVLIFSGALEYAQTFLPAHATGSTDIIMACLGAWMGSYICSSVESARANTQLIVNRFP